MVSLGEFRRDKKYKINDALNKEQLKEFLNEFRKSQKNNEIETQK